MAGELLRVLTGPLAYSGPGKNDNLRFSVHPNGPGYGIWDIQSGGFTGQFDTAKQAQNFAQWQNYLNSKMPRY